MIHEIQLWSGEMGLDMYLYTNKFLCRSNWGSEEENKMVSEL
jgi:hypothetical protein